MHEPSELPTHLALVRRRLLLQSEADLAGTFLETSYLAEAFLKTLGVALHAGLRRSAYDVWYRIAYDLLRADGLGAWESAIREVSSPPTANYFPKDFHPLLVWLTQRRRPGDDRWFFEIESNLVAVLEELGVPAGDQRRRSVRDLLTLLVQIRNKTKGHGAVTDTFYEAINQKYSQAVLTLVSSCPINDWRWVHLTRRDAEHVRAIALMGSQPQHLREAEARRLEPLAPGIHFIPSAVSQPFLCTELLIGNRDCTSFLLPNGGCSATSSEFIDYGTGVVEARPMDTFVAPPATLQASETEGLSEFDIQSNSWGNLPGPPRVYVSRPGIEKELRKRLVDQNHPVITLHGGGGMGKTSLALQVAHQMASEGTFEHIVWLSARDVDLRPTGPSRVKQNIDDLKSIAHVIGSLFNPPGGADEVEAFAQMLRSPARAESRAILFIFDNFETLAEVRGLQLFLTENATTPNKVLITSRERSFVADWPIEVRGMEFAEAHEMLTLLGADLGIQGLVTDEVIEKIYEATGGHAYVMRVVLGEVAKTGRYQPSTEVVARRADIVDAVFERSFNRLSDAARHVFLLISSWRSPVPARGLTLVLGARGIDATSAVDECLRLSLIQPDEVAGQECYSAPHLARLFGKKKLQGDPDRLVIQADLETLQSIGNVTPGGRAEDESQRLIERFVRYCHEEAQRSGEGLQRADALLGSLASVHPPAWLDLATLREQGGDPARVDLALRRAVEEMPFSKEVLLRRANWARARHDENTEISSLVSAVDAEPDDTLLMTEVAARLADYLSTHKTEIPKTRRGVYLASVRSHMERAASKLDSTGLSRLAWLFLLDDQKERAREFALRGLARDPSNTHCLRMIEKLEGR